MRKYESHTVVEAGQITAAAFQQTGPEDGYALLTVDGVEMAAKVEHRTFIMRHSPNHCEDGLIGGWLIKYPDGYLSWCPDAVFRRDYSRIFDAEGVAHLTFFKQLEQAFLTRWELLQKQNRDALVTGDAERAVADGRWLAEARTDLEKAIMCITRALFNPPKIPATRAEFRQDTETPRVRDQ